MSVTIVLLPFALAAAAAGSGIGIAGAVRTAMQREEAPAAPAPAPMPLPLAVRTRMKDRDLLAAALADLGAVDVVVGEQVEAVVGGLELTMTQDDGVWTAHLVDPGGRAVAEQEAVALLTRLDEAYAGHVQHAVAERIRARAVDAGFDLVSESVDQDDTLTMVLNVHSTA